MNQLTRLWNSLSTAQRISLIVVPILVCAASLGLVKWKHESDFRTLYSALAPEDAAAVTQKIREASIEYRLDESGTSVMVPAAKLAEARLALAGAGLPRTGRIGFELFDRVNLGASDFTEQVNYRRALEGELEKTVATLSEIDQARIHITFAKDSVFLDSRQPAKATVVLRLKRAPQLSTANVSAIANLVASAVDGLAPEAVAIIDSGGRLLNRPRSSSDSEATTAETNLDFRQQMEAELLSKINAAVEPLVGAGKFRAGINVDCDFSSAEQSEEVYDQTKSAVLTSQTSEESTSAASTGGAPGTASNLPQPPARAAGGSSGVMRRTENVTYQPSRTIRKTLLPKGTIRRMSTAVLVDQVVRWQGTGAKAKKTLVAPSPEVLRGIHDVVAGITGFNEQRGDQITVESLPFESTLEAEPPSMPVTSPGQPSGSVLKQPIVLGAIAAFLVALLVAGFALRGRRQKSVAVEDMAAGALPIAAGVADLPAQLSQEARMEQQIADNQASQERSDEETLSRIMLPVSTKKTDVLVKHLREAISKDPATAANVLRTWVTDAEPRRS